MKSTRLVLVILVAAATTAAFAQADAQKTFNQLKTLSGNWEGKASNGKDLKVTDEISIKDKKALIILKGKF